MAITQTYPFTTPGNYTYDAGKIVVEASQAQLEEAADTSCFASYDTDIDLTFALGSVTGTATGGAAVAGGKLDLTGGTLQYVTYSATDNADFTQKGCIRVPVTPNYSGAPAADRAFIYVSTGLTVNNAIWIYHSAAGNLTYSIYNSSGSTIASAVAAAWSPTAGTEYEIELNIDIDTGANRIFVDGTQLGTTNTNTGTRTAADTIIVGTNAFTSQNPDHSINNLHIFSAVQHTANFTPGDLLYVVDNPTIYPTTAFNADALYSFAATTIETGSDLVKLTMSVDGVEMYWTGAAWAASSGYAQSNTVADVVANITTLISAGATVYPVIYLHSDDGTTTPSIDIITISFDFYAPPETAPQVCVVWGYIYDSSGNPLENQSVIATLQPSSFTAYNQLIAETPNVATTDASGFFELNLIRTSEIALATLYDIEIRYTGYLDEAFPQTFHKIENITIPDQDSVELKDI